MAILTHCDLGPRRFDLHPTPVVSRSSWEVVVVLAGPLMPELRTGMAKPREAYLWCWAPELVHGWRMPAGAESTLAVFHFCSLPEILAKEVRLRGGCLERSMNGTELKQVRTWYQELRTQFPSRGKISELYYQKVLSELAILLLEGGGESPAYSNENVVSQAMGWYSHHLHEGPGLEEVGRAIGVSVSHLRRLFKRIKGQTPQVLCLALRMRRAKEMILGGERDQTTIAIACGYADAPTFGRAFKREVGASPQAWRRKEMEGKSGL